MNSKILEVAPKSIESAKLEDNIRPVLVENLDSEISLVHVSNNELSLAITRQALQEVAKAIARQAKISIIFDKEIPNPFIDLKFSNLSVRNRVCKDYSRIMILFYSNFKETLAKLTTVWVYPQDQRFASITSPISVPANERIYKT